MKTNLLKKITLNTLIMMNIEEKRNLITMNIEGKRNLGLKSTVGGAEIEPFK